MKKLSLVIGVLILSLTGFAQRQQPSRTQDQVFASTVTKLTRLPADEVLFSAAEYEKLKTRSGWLEIGISQEDKKGLTTHTYYDLKRIEQRGEAIKEAWTRFETLKDKTLVSYFLTLDQYDCNQRRTRNLQLVNYDAEGHSIANDEGDKTWGTIIPDSINEGMYQVICQKRYDPETTNMLAAAIAFAKGKHAEKRGDVKEAREQYSRVLLLVPENEKALAALNH